MKNLTLIAAAGLFAMATGFAGQAQAATPACQATVTSSTVFDSDLDCSTLTGDPVVGLTIGDNNITVNLNGYTIVGPANFGAIGSGACPAGFGGTPHRTIGILVNNFHNINIIDGIITGFEVGMMVKNAAGVGIKDIEANNNAFNALSVGDFDNIQGGALGGVPDLVVNRVNFHDNRNDAVGVSPNSSLSMLNSRVKDNCASGIFAAPLFFNPDAFPSGTPKANVDVRRSSFEGNFRSAVNFWGATGSVQHSLIKGNNANTASSFGSDFG